MFNNFFSPENRVVYEVMFTDGVEQGRPRMTIWRMRIACWVTNATNRHSEHVILIAFLLQQWLRERATMIRYTFIVCLIEIKLKLKLVVCSASYQSVRNTVAVVSLVTHVITCEVEIKD